MIPPVDVDTKGRRLMANPFVHVELNTTDPDKAKAFYRELFTWTMDDMQMGPDMTYTMIQPGEGTGGGLMKQPMPGAPSAWLAYVDVDDVKASTEKVRSLGGQVLKDVTEVPQMGWFSVIADPTGAVLGLWQTAR
jgi:predicted enzyme related to lactoylglutathione lyase